MSTRSCVLGAVVCGASVHAWSQARAQDAQPAGPLATPLVLAFAGDGQIHHVAQPVPFDFYGLGEPLPMSWPAGDTPLLTLDQNGNGRIDDGSELFGDATPIQADPGRTAEHGFAALAQHDLDHNGVIDQADPAFARILVWSDANQNGLSDEGELQSLAARKIRALALTHAATTVADGQGTVPRLTGHYVTDTDEHRLLADIWLRIHDTGATAMAAADETDKRPR